MAVGGDVCAFCQAMEGHYPGCTYYAGNGQTAQGGIAEKVPVPPYCEGCEIYGGGHLSSCDKYFPGEKTCQQMQPLETFLRLDTREKYLSFFKSLTDKMYELTRKKNNDYGGAVDPFKNFREFGSLGILVRMSDKFARIKTALHEKRELEVADESVEDTVLDLATYSLLLLCWIRSEGR